MSKRLQITLTDDGYERLIYIINQHFHGSCSKSTAIECAIFELEKYLNRNEDWYRSRALEAYEAIPYE